MSVLSVVLSRLVGRRRYVWTGRADYRKVELLSSRVILGAVESVTAGYLDPYVGGGTKDFIPYVLMILVLFIRPYGIWGHETIERV